MYLHTAKNFHENFLGRSVNMNGRSDKPILFRVYNRIWQQESDLWLCLKYFSLYLILKCFSVQSTKDISDFFRFLFISLFAYGWQPDHTLENSLLHFWTMPRNIGFTSSFHNLFQLSEVPNLSHLKSGSGMGNVLTVWNARSHWWAKDSWLGRMKSFVMNVALLHRSVESCTAALFLLCSDVLHYSAVRKSSKRYNSYLVIQVTFQQQFNSNSSQLSVKKI